MSQKELDNNNYLCEFNDNLDNIFNDKNTNTVEFEKSLFENNNNININTFNNNINRTPNFPKSKKAFNKKNNNIKTNNNKRQYFTNSKNSIRTTTTPNHSILTRSKLSTNSKNNSFCKNTHNNFRKNSLASAKKSIDKELNIINKLTQEVQHIKNYCNELQRQFDNHCLIKNEKKEFENIKKENIKLTAEVSILKDDVAELMKKYGNINNKIESIQQENNNLKIQNKNLLNFISIMSNSTSTNGINKLKNFNITSLTNQELTNNNKNQNNNNESMNIINLINNNNNKNSLINESRAMNNTNTNNNKNDIYNISNNLNNFDKLNFNINNNNNFNLNNLNNLNSEQIEFSISKSLSKNFEKPELNSKNYFKTINDSKLDYTNAITNSNTNINIQSRTKSDFRTIGHGNKNTGNNGTDIISLIQSNFNLTNQNRNSSNSKNKQGRFLIPKDDN